MRQETLAQIHEHIAPIAHSCEEFEDILGVMEALIAYAARLASDIGQQSVEVPVHRITEETGAIVVKLLSDFGTEVIYED